MDDLSSRVAVLEQIARFTQAALERIERRLDTIEATQRSQFLWLLGAFGAGYLSLLLMMLATLGPNRPYPALDLTMDEELKQHLEGMEPRR